jgi:hypothetical protein
MNYKDFGYLLIISKNSKVDYLKLAYALALSIKITQKPGFDKVALITDDIESVKALKSSWVFDHIQHWDQETYWDGRAWMDLLTPWDNTVCLDVDMLFFRDYSHWIEYFLKNSTELFMPSVSYTYRGDEVSDDYYRKTFTNNLLPNVYSFYTYFKKNSSKYKEFFPLARHITKHPTEFKNMYLPKYAPKIVGTDEAFALSAKILGIDEEVTYKIDFPKVVHLKPMIQGWPWPSDSISDHVGLYFDLAGQLKIGNYQQHDIVHYNEKEFITDEVISILENIIWKKQ